MTQPRAAFYRSEGDVFVPTSLGRSPWDKTSQGGVALAGLVARVLETAPTRVPMLTARITLDIMGSVPMEPLTPAVRILRDGPRMQLVEAELQAGGRTWVRATALRARIGSSPEVVQPLTHPLPANVEPHVRTAWFEIYRENGDFDGEAAGAGAMWVNIIADVIDGEPLTPLQRFAITADFGSGAAPVVAYKEYTSANLDIAMHMSRDCVGEWLLLDSLSESAGNGIGIARARIGDVNGMFASTLQTTFLNRR